MADIFLSYAREDFAKAALLANALEKQGWSVFWDRSSILTGQDFDQVIEQAIQDAKWMIVGWSNASKQSDWVRGEATIGRERRILLPVLFELVQPPIAFRSLHTEDLSAWRGEAGAPAFRALCKALRQRLEPDKPRSVVTPENRTPPERLPLKPVDPEKTNHKIAKLVGSVLVLATLGGIAIHYLPDSQHASTTSEVNTVPIKPTTVSQKQLKPPEMIPIPAGEFWMGSGDNDNEAKNDEKPRHKVKVAAFAMGKYEVTKAEFSAFANDSGHQASGCFVWNGSEWKTESGKNWQNPGFTQSDADPVTCVSHDDALSYIRWLNTKTGLNYRLPTEAEWEYAARAGATGDFYWGQDDPNDYAWYSNNSGNKTHPTGKLKPNGFELYDMSGNVWEWTCSEYTEGYVGSEGRCATGSNPLVLRGGSWLHMQVSLRSAFRGKLNPDRPDNTIGFRLAQD